MIAECGDHEEINQIFQVNEFGNIVLMLKDNDKILFISELFFKLLRYLFGNDMFSKFFDDIFTLTIKLEDLGHIVSQIMHNVQETAQLEDITDANEHIDKGRDYSIVIITPFIGHELQGAGLKTWQTRIGVRMRAEILTHSIRSTSR